MGKVAIQSGHGNPSPEVMVETAGWRNEVVRGKLCCIIRARRGGGQISDDGIQERERASI